jgi:hypothetical protein
MPGLPCLLVAGRRELDLVIRGTPHDPSRGVIGEVDGVLFDLVAD